MLKNIPLSADEELINAAREKAQREHTTLNENFRRWLRRYAMSGSNKSKFEYLMSELEYADPGKKFSRDEFNER